MGKITRNELAPVLTAELDNISKAIFQSEKGVTNGVATLDETGKIPSTQLPEATVTSKGQVQLSSALDSESETTAATSKAVKTVDEKINSIKNEIAYTRIQYGVY